MLFVNMMESSNLGAVKSHFRPPYLNGFLFVHRLSYFYSGFLTATKHLNFKLFSQRSKFEIKMFKSDEYFNLIISNF